MQFVVYPKCISSVYTPLTPWNIVLLEKLIVIQLVKKLLAFYGTRRFFTVFTRFRCWFLS
jgi:hypothetical protein